MLDRHDIRFAQTPGASYQDVPFFADISIPFLRTLRVFSLNPGLSPHFSIGFPVAIMDSMFANWYGVIFIPFSSPTANSIKSSGFDGGSHLPGEGFDGVEDEVGTRLLKLIEIGGDQGQRGVQLLLHLDML